MLRLRAPTRTTVRADLRHECGRYLRSSGGALCRHGSTSQAGLFGDLQPDVDLAKNDIPRPENQTHLSPRCVCCGAAFRHVALLTHRARKPDDLADLPFVSSQMALIRRAYD